MGVLNPSPQLIFSPNPSSQLLKFLQSQPIIREFWQIPKSQLILGKQSQSQLFLRANPRSQLMGIRTLIDLVAYVPLWICVCLCVCGFVLQSSLVWTVAPRTFLLGMGVNLDLG